MMINSYMENFQDHQRTRNNQSIPASGCREWFLFVISNLDFVFPPVTLWVWQPKWMLKEEDFLMKLGGILFIIFVGRDND